MSSSGASLFKALSTLAGISGVIAIIVSIWMYYDDQGTGTIVLISGFVSLVVVCPIFSAVSEALENLKTIAVNSTNILLHLEAQKTSHNYDPDEIPEI